MHPAAQVRYGKYSTFMESTPLTSFSCARQAGNNKLQTEDSEEDENGKRRLRSTSASAGQVWRKHAEIRDHLDKVVPVLH